MNVRCPSCSTVYRVDPAKVPEQGVRARCAVCASVFAVGREAVATMAPAAAPVAPERAAPTPPPPAAPTPAPAPMPVATSAPRVPVAAPPAAPPRWIVPPVVAPSPRGGPVSPPAMPGSRPPVMPRPAGLAVATPPAMRTPVSPPSPGRPLNPFLAGDPSQKARRLARALVSDMVVYHPAKRRQALQAGNLKEAFEEEIAKSWEEYVEQVGRELADSTSHFRDALNEILADGRALF
jgi:predicted Zn finger-like uncharacterized protein